MTLLGILVAHEFGHYFAARYHKVAVSLPYFIPLPIGFGTLGAFIRLREQVPDRRKLFDIGVAGPLAGLVIAIPMLFYGLSTSPLDVAPQGVPVELEGNSILYFLAKIAVFGQALPNHLTGQDVFMNQVTFAAWIGLLVTALNLLPVGQLDGGHTVYALFGEKARYINLGDARCHGSARHRRFGTIAGAVASPHANWLFRVVAVVGADHLCAWPLSSTGA